MTEIHHSPEDYSQVQEIWCDSFRVTLNDYSAALSLGQRGLKPSDDTTRVLYNVRMPLSQLKALAFLALRVIRTYEAQAGVTITLPPKLLEALGIPLEDWQGGLR
ncbi:MAG: hypothetical protein Q8R28_11215 [Dehalococcoidia bacterium]|nr:hypothetical protein [Dehalococcoidia bacterium]